MNGRRAKQARRAVVEFGDLLTEMGVSSEVKHSNVKHRTASTPLSALESVQFNWTTSTQSIPARQVYQRTKKLVQQRAKRSPAKRVVVHA